MARFYSALLRLIVLCLCALVSLTDCRAEDTGAADLETIWRSFAARQNAVDSADVHWDKSAIHVGAAARFGGGPLRPGEEVSPVAIPLHRCRLAVSGDRVRYEHDAISKLGGSNGEVVTSAKTFNGRLGQTFYDKSDFKPPTGIVQTTDDFRDWRVVDLRGLSYALRPLRPEMFGESPGRWQLDARTSNIDGRECLVMIGAPTDTAMVRRVYLDPLRDYVPLRVQCDDGGAPQFQVDMQYERTEEPKWVPSSWNVIMYQFGDLNSFGQSENELVSIELGKPLPDETFEIDFPPGTELTTIIDGKDELKTVTADGEWVPTRLVTAEATPAVASSWWPWVAGALGLVALGLAVMLLWQRTGTARR